MTDAMQNQLDALNVEREKRLAHARGVYQTNDHLYGIGVADRQYDQMTTDIREWYDAELDRIRNGG